MAPASRIANSPNTVRILISSDNHVGYNERDPIRGDDSWKTFHEIMLLAKELDVDMVLLAGDLFHENKPSRKSMYQVMKTLRATCYGDKPCELELLSEADLSLRDAFGHINYEDPDINVAIPVLAISGNHDDASGDGNLAALDIISVTGLVNHFGRVPENDNITLTPLLFRKGYTNIALYGMANVRDERLHRTFRDRQVKFLRPESEEDGSDNWFNIMALHQNHHAHTETGYIPETFLPRFLDLVVWGHEHECIMDPQHNPEQGFDVIQPGSSVVTSLCEGEAAEKFVGIVSIEGSKYEMEKIKLKTVRPFVMREVILARDCGFAASSKNKGQVIRWLIQQVTELIELANEQWIQANSDENGELLTGEDAPLPLVRLRVEYSGGYEVENPRRFSNRFVGKVANVNDVVQFYRKKTATTVKRTNAVGEANEVVDAVDLDHIKVQSLVEEFLKLQTLDVLPAGGLNDAISQYVDKDDKQAIKTFVDETLEKQMKRLLSLGDVDEEELEHVITSAANKVQESVGKVVPSKRAHAEETSGNKRNKGAASRGRRAKQASSGEDASSMDEEVSNRTAPSKATSKPRVQPRRNARTAAETSLFVGDDDDESLDDADDVMLEDSSDVEYDRSKTKTPQTRATNSRTTRASQAAPTSKTSNPKTATTRKTPASRSTATLSQTTLTSTQRGPRSEPRATVQTKLNLRNSADASRASAATNRQTSMSTTRMAPMDVIDVEDDPDDAFA
ncbi:Mre11 DNA-binding presumed domain-containing protein [Lipomyces tetrasporus]|uniref:Double-strand break repair protein n=1 Tax=Lipomyces tetrasporus TaxID=54092 RepID=A0AAD7QLR5_9ASCO|nr:Mre11 DNA-binding presumed domain-containing protein [Lipomyces tetrasporus]KAJ8097528.1 Mre11 DNA-binding presumed domain-containing protein [Lipomyces tetrasporus]